jgi:hypothetical protein
LTESVLKHRLDVSRRFLRRIDAGHAFRPPQHVQQASDLRVRTLDTCESQRAVGSKRAGRQFTKGWPPVQLFLAHFIEYVELFLPSGL